LGIELFLANPVDGVHMEDGVAQFLVKHGDTFLYEGVDGPVLCLLLLGIGLFLLAGSKCKQATAEEQQPQAVNRCADSIHNIIVNVNGLGE
jgi:hypothetical protein